MTCRQDRLPEGVPKTAFHHMKGVKVDHRTRVTRFEQSVVAGIRRGCHEWPLVVLLVCASRPSIVLPRRHTLGVVLLGCPFGRGGGHPQSAWSFQRCPTGGPTWRRQNAELDPVPTL